MVEVEYGPIIKLFQDILQIGQDFGGLGSYIFDFMNLPTSITLLDYSINVSGILSLFLVSMVILGVISVMLHNAKYILYGAISIFLLTLLAKIFGG